MKFNEISVAFDLRDEYIGVKQDISELVKIRERAFYAKYICLSVDFNGEYNDFKLYGESDVVAVTDAFMELYLKKEKTIRRKLEDLGVTMDE